MFCEKENSQKVRFDNGFELSIFDSPACKASVHYFKDCSATADNNKLNSGNEICINIVFNTPTYNSTGVQHILEHTVIAGSQSIPLKDLFITLSTRGSVNKELNAYTADTYTSYHFSSYCYQDALNLLQLHLDTIFHPLSIKDERVFRQEGWRYHITDTTDKLDYRGVVYSEMCAAYSSIEELASYEIQEMLFHNTPLAQNAHGNPKDIINLTYENYKAYYDQFYHLGNCTIIVASSIEPNIFLQDLQNIVQRLNIQNIEKQFVNIPNEFTLQPITKREKQIPCEDNEADKHTFYRASLGKTIADISDLEYYALLVLNKLMHEIPGNLFQRQLVEKGLCESFTSERIMKQHYLYIQLSIEKYQLNYEQHILQLVGKIYEDYLNGRHITKELFNAIINSFIIETLNKSDDEYQQFIDMYLSYKGGMIPVNKIQSLCNAKTCLKRLISLNEDQTQALIKDVIKTYYLNPSSHLFLRPSSSLQIQQQYEHEVNMNDIKQRLSRQELDDILFMQKKITQLAEQEDNSDDVAKLPKLSINDAVQILNNWNLIKYSTSNDKFIYIDTNEDLIMFKIIFYPRVNNLQELQHLILMVSHIGKLRTKNYSLNDLQLEMLQCVDDYDYGTYQTNQNVAITFQYNCLPYTAEKGTKLFIEIMRNTLFEDVNEIRSQIYDIKNDLYNTLNSDSCNIFAKYRSLAVISKSNVVQDALNGYGYYKFIFGLDICQTSNSCENSEQYEEFNEKSETHSSSTDESAMDEQLKLMQNLFERVFSNIDTTVLVSCNNQHMDIVQKCVQALEEEQDGKIFKLITQIPNQDEFMQKIKLYDGDMVVETQQSINYIAKAISVNKITSEMYLICHILSNQYLWNKLRIHGGAYYVNASIAQNSIIIQSGSDPNYDQTIYVIDHICDYVKSLYIDQEELDQIKISVISQLCPPKTQNEILNVLCRTIISKKDVEQLYQLYKGIINVTIDQLQQLSSQFERLHNIPAVAFIRKSQQNQCYVQK